MVPNWGSVVPVDRTSDGFHRLFTPFLCPDSSGRSWRLTFLTPACQNCQTRLPFLASRCDETSRHHTTSAHGTVGLVQRVHRVTWRSEAAGNGNLLRGYSHPTWSGRSHHAVFRTIPKVRP